MKNHAISITLLVFVGVTMVWPLVRHRVALGDWPVTFHREADPFQKLMGALLGMITLSGLVWAGLLFWVPWGLLAVWQAPAWPGYLGFALVGGGMVLEIGGQWAMKSSFRMGIDDRPTRLVTTGIFRMVRNPIFTGLLTSFLGIVLLTPSPWTVVTFLWAASLICIQVRLEEAHLTRLHGDEYLEYARTVGRFVPGIGRLG